MKVIQNNIFKEATNQKIDGIYKSISSNKNINIIILHDSSLVINKKFCSK